MATQVSLHSGVGALGHGLAAVMDPPLSPTARRQILFSQQQPEPAAVSIRHDAAVAPTAVRAVASVYTTRSGGGYHRVTDQLSAFATYPEREAHPLDEREREEDIMPAATTAAPGAAPGGVNGGVRTVPFADVEGDRNTAVAVNSTGGVSAGAVTNVMPEDVDMNFLDDGVISMATDDVDLASVLPVTAAANRGLESNGGRRRSSVGSAVGVETGSSPYQAPTFRRGSVSGGRIDPQNGVISSSTSSRRRRSTLGGGGGGGTGGLRSGLSRKFVRSLMRHLNMRADSRQREELRSMVETLKCVANRPGVDMKQELKREAVSLLGPELAREAFEASLTETRNDFYRQRSVAAAAAAEAAASTEALGGGSAAAAAAAAAAASAATASARRRESGFPPIPVGSWSGSSGGGSSVSTGSAVGGSLPRVEARPPPRKRRSFGGSDKLDSNGEDPPEASSPDHGSASFFEALPAEEVEQRLKAFHKGPLHEDFHLCCVCMDRPRDAALIHGKTSHQACCYDCALELFERGLPCPCCRQSIAHVVKNFL